MYGWMDAESCADIIPRGFPVQSPQPGSTAGSAGSWWPKCHALPIRSVDWFERRAAKHGSTFTTMVSCRFSLEKPLFQWYVYIYITTHNKGILNDFDVIRDMAGLWDATLAESRHRSCQAGNHRNLWSFCGKSPNWILPSSSLLLLTINCLRTRKSPTLFRVFSSNHFSKCFLFKSHSCVFFLKTIIKIYTIIFTPGDFHNLWAQKELMRVETERARCSRDPHGSEPWRDVATPGWVFHKHRH